MHGWIADIEQTANAEHNTPDDVLRIFFEITDSSRQAGRAYLSRAFARTEDRDKPNGPEVKRAQYDAIVEWGIPDPGQLNRLAGITQPTLVANGANDTMTPTINSQILADHIPNARLRVYPDAGHGFLFLT
jgi:pimeloyl-ACP methyl ester carboxylesterase